MSADGFGEIAKQRNDLFFHGHVDWSRADCY